MTGWLAAGCVAVAAAVAGWPVPGARARVRRVLGAAGARHRRARRLVWTRRLPARLPPPMLVVAAGVVLAGVLGGAVAGVVAAAYGTVAARAVTRRGRDRTRALHRAALLDALGSAAADLRAGLPAGTALAGLEPPASSQDPLLARVRAAVRLAERTGAPLAEVLERVEADARGADRAGAAASAQAAGSAATAWLLAALPAGGIGLGYAIGADPLPVLLHTPLGAGCALGAVTLQLAGLAWTRRIIRPPATFDSTFDGHAQAAPA